MTTTIGATSLESLLAILRRGELTDAQWTDLPTFGGEEPRNTSSVWSWDATRLLVGTCADDIRIVDRADWRPRGRPPLRSARSVLLTLRVTPEDRARYTEAARHSGQGLSAWLRELADRASRSA